MHVDAYHGAFPLGTCEIHQRKLGSRSGDRLV
jgi:hypothetical protein